MAGTRVRYGWGSYARSASRFLPTALVTDRLIGPDTYLVIFILVQTGQFALLWRNDGLDLSLALCLSAGLVAAAGLFSTQRIEQPAPTQPIASPPAALMAPLAHPAELATPISIDEQSQTWADLMARISHEIRTPLNAVIGFSDLMEREIFGPLGNPRYRDYAAHIKDSGEALLKSAEDTLALSSLLATPTPDQRQQCSNLAALTRDAWHAIEPHATRRTVSIDLRIPDALEVAGDRRAIRQALSNLLLEAATRASVSSRVEVTARAEADTVWIKVAAPDVGRYCGSTAPSLAICVARALLELHGTSLVTAERPGNAGWQATTVLDLTVQADFFAATRSTHLVARQA